MEYNTSRGDIVIPEYGRHMQLLIENAKKIENREERQAFVEKVVDLIQQMYPQTRNVDDYVAKLWSHVFRIADYDLDVDPPCEILSREEVYKRPEALPYPGNKVKFRHYGKNVQEMVAKATAIEDSELRDEYVQVIGAYMKMAYKTWNGEHVSDDMIRKNLVKISDGALELEEDANIDNLINPSRPYRKISSTAATSTANRSSSSNRPTRPTTNSRTTSSSSRTPNKNSSSTNNNNSNNNNKKRRK